MSNKGLGGSRDPIRWVWVWGPDYYLNEDDSERNFVTEHQDHLSSGGSEDEFWGTCHKDTEPGELVVLYRAGLKKDIGYLLRTTTSAKINDQWSPKGAKSGWTYIAGFEPVARLDPPISIAELRQDPDLESWGALRGRFQRAVFSLKDQHSQAMWDLLASRTTSPVPPPPPPGPNLPKESVIESALVRDGLKAMQDVGGPRLKLWKGPGGVLGRQLPCSRAGGRLDLLCVDQRDKALVVVELKVVRANEAVVAQILKYIGWVKRYVAEGRPVRGIVIADGESAAYRSAIEGAGLGIQTLPVRDLGIRLGVMTK